MLGKSSFLGASSSSYDKRIFVYEVEGLGQNTQPESISCPVRQSGRVMLQIPYHRMNDEMRNIIRMGGKIVSIRSLGEDSSENTSDQN